MWMYTTDNSLYHHGIKGQRWGVRRFQPYSNGHIDGKFVGETNKRASFSTRRKAKKDAKEYARAKMFYGKGAGTRRKLIKAKVNERSKDDAYKAEFEKHLAKQNMAAHASKAKAERHVKDAASTTAKTARGLYHLSAHDVAKVSAGAAAIYGLAHFTGADKKASAYAKQKVSDFLKNKDAIRKGKNATKDWVIGY